MAEFNRKYQRLENQLSTVMNLLAQQAQTQQSPAKGEATEEELWSLAQQGDRGAFDLYMQRKAHREAQQVYQSQAREATVQQQVYALASRYPVFNDQTHPLTIAATTAYQLMVRNGYPQGQTTLLDAMKTAIADRPDLVADMVSRAPDAARVSATRRAQAGQTGATTRDVPLGNAPRPTQASAEQQRLARAYGVKDAAGAIDRFKKRQESGQSSLGMVANAITEEI
jgi:hypothetical protein